MCLLILSDKTSTSAIADLSESLICVKEDLLRKSPNSLTRTFLNANIITYYLANKRFS